MLIQLRFIEQDLPRNLSLSGLLPAPCPEELVLPVLQMFGLVDEGEQTGKDADTIERITIRCKIWVRKGRMVLQDDQSRCDREQQCFEVR